MHNMMYNTSSFPSNFFLMKIHAKTREKDNSHREDVACLPCLATKGGGAIDLKYY